MNFPLRFSVQFSTVMFWAKPSACQPFCWCWRPSTVITAPAMSLEVISRKERFAVVPFADVVTTIPRVLLLGSQPLTERSGSKTLPLKWPPNHLKSSISTPEKSTMRACLPSFSGRTNRAP